MSCKKGTEDSKMSLNSGYTTFRNTIAKHQWIAEITLESTFMKEASKK